jgi:hypothetical protein
MDTLERRPNKLGQRDGMDTYLVGGEGWNGYYRKEA